MPSSVARLIGQDHDRMTRLLRRISAPGPSRHRWRDELVALIRAHSVAERDELLAGAAAVTSAPDLELPPSDAAALEQLAVEVERAELDGSVDELSTQIERALSDHAARMRRDVLDVLERVLARKEMRRLGGRYVERRDAELSSASSGTPPRALDRSRAELYEMARRVGIQGRSSMTRTQLINALRGQTHS